MEKVSISAQAPGLFASLESVDASRVDTPLGLTEFFRFRFGTGAGGEAINCQPGNLDIVKKELTETLGPPENMVVLQGDICRRELLVEIEGNHWI